jgi:hypothetical protein
LIFNVTGTSSTNNALSFEQGIMQPLQNDELDIVNQSVTGSAGVDGVVTFDTAGPYVLNNLTSPVGTSTTYTLAYGGEFTFMSVGTQVTLEGSSDGGDAVLMGGDGTYDAGSNSTTNSVTFTDGTNTYNGGNSTDDVITAGAGYDTINAGTGGGNTVFSGAGSTTINLDNGADGTGDVVFLGDGTSTVTASGAGDDTIAASTSGNVIYGGPGNLYFVGETGLGITSDTIIAGSGTAVMFGSANDSISLTNDTTSAQFADVFVAGAGNETLNGANAANGFAFFGNPDTSASVSDSVIGGSGTNYFSTGAGSETLVGGSGANVFDLNTVGGSGAHITIDNFTASDYISTEGTYTESVSNGNLTLTLSDNTTVEFVGVNSISSSHITINTTHLT